MPNWAHLEQRSSEYVVVRKCPKGRAACCCVSSAAAICLHCTARLSKGYS